MDGRWWMRDLINDTMPCCSWNDEVFNYILIRNYFPQMTFHAESMDDACFHKQNYTRTFLSCFRKAEMTAQNYKDCDAMADPGFLIGVRARTLYFVKISWKTSIKSRNIWSGEGRGGAGGGCCVRGARLRDYVLFFGIRQRSGYERCQIV